MTKEEIENKIDELRKMEEIVSKKMSTLEADMFAHRKFFQDIRYRVFLDRKYSKLHRELQEELNEYKQQIDKHYELLRPFLLDEEVYRLDEKNKACQNLINDILKTEIIHDAAGHEIIVSQELKMAFIEEIGKLLDLQGLSYTYDYKETDDYSISEGLTLNSTGSIELFVTVNDFGIAAKQHTHYKTIDEMLIKYMNYTNEKSQSSSKTL